MTENLLLSVVLPVRNEGPNIARILRDIDQLVPRPREVLVVHDVEQDDTVPVVRRAQQRMPELFLIHNRLGQGVLNAIKTGISAARGRYILVTMADGSDELGVVPRMLDAARAGAVIVAASRYMPGGAQYGGPRLKRVLSRLAGLLLHHIGGLPVHDATNSFKLYDREFLRSVRIESDGGFEVSLEFCVKAHRRGLTIAEVPTVWRERTAGGSHFALRAWIPRYLRWFWYGIATRWVGRAPASRTAGR